MERTILEFFLSLPYPVRLLLNVFSLLVEYGAIVWLYLLILGALSVRKREYLEVVLVALAGLALQAVLNELILHRIWNRPRPFDLMQVETIGLVWHSSSFVSGHTLTAAVMATIFSSYFPRWTPVFGSFAILTGISRLSSGMHWPSDVVGAWVFGFFAGVLVLKIGEWIVKRPRLQTPP